MILEMGNIVVIGGGGHARVVTNILKKNQQFRVIGYTDHEDKGSILGCPYLGNDSILESLIAQRQACAAAIGIGMVKVITARICVMENLEMLGFDIPAIVSKDAVLNENVIIGKASMVGDGAIINCGSKIGVCSIINTNSTVEHDCDIGSYVHIAPGAIISGEVKIGNHSFVGAGAIIIQGKTIGENVTIGAGATVVRDCLSPGTYIGTPARRIK